MTNQFNTLKYVEIILNRWSYEEPKDVISTVEWLFQTLKLDNKEKDNVVKLTEKRLQKLFSEKNIKYNHPIIPGFKLYKDETGGTKWVYFNVDNNQITAEFDHLLDSPEDIEKINNINQHMEESRYHGGKVDPTADRILRN